MIKVDENTKMGELFKLFQIHCPDLVQEMKNSDHHYDHENINPYHIESDVFTHTFGVCLLADKNGLSLLEKLACLLHDVGKPMSRGLNHEKKRVNFIGHEGLSVFKSLDFLNKLDLTNDQKTIVLKLISWHTILYKMDPIKQKQDIIEKFYKEPELYLSLINVSECDSQGRFSEALNDDFHNKKEQFKALYNEMLTFQPKIEKKPKIHDAFVLVGPSCSGKSTYLKDKSGKILSRDDLFAKSEDYEKDWNEADQKEVQKKFIQVLEQNKQEPVIWLDLTHLSPKSRRRYNHYFNQHRKNMIIFINDMNTLIDRNKNRQGKDLSSALPSQMESFLWPFSNEYDSLKVIW